MLDELLDVKRQSFMAKEWRFGVIATLVANLVPDKSRPRPYEPADFFPHLAELSETPDTTADKTPDQLLSIVMGINASLGGKDLRRITQSGTTQPVAQGSQTG